MFGSLTLDCVEEGFLRRLCLHLNRFDEVTLGNLSRDLIPLALAGPVEHLTFGVQADKDFDVDVLSVDIVAPNLCANMEDLSSSHPMQFITSFLDQMAKSEHLKKLRWNYETVEETVADVVAKPFVGAMINNQSLDTLELINAEQ